MRDHWRTADVVVRLSGPTVLTWANGLFTNNVQALQIGDWHRTAMLDERGRVQGLMSLGRVDELVLCVVLEGQSFEEFEARYRMHALLDDVVLTPLDWQVHAVVGALPAKVQGGLVVPSVRAIEAGHDLVGEPEWIATVVAKCGPEASEQRQKQLRISAGIPAWPTDFSGKNLCHEMGMRDAYLSFDKGCYLGQETVMRVDVRGQVKKQLRGLVMTGEPTEVQVQLNDKKMGRLTSWVQHPTLGFIGLAVLKDDASPGTTVQIASDTATVVALPFAS